MQADAPNCRLDDYLSYGPTQVEVNAGKMVFSAARSGPQPRVITRLTRRLDRFVLRARLGVLLESAPFVFEGDAGAGWVRNARRCDLAFVSQARIGEMPGRGQPWWLAPDLTADVVDSASWAEPMPDERAADYVRWGVRLAWVIDTLAREVRVYSPDAPDGRTLTGEAMLSGEPVIPGWSVEVESVFGR